MRIMADISFRLDYNQRKIKSYEQDDDPEDREGDSGGIS